jgi:hypothetical protein
MSFVPLDDNLTFPFGMIGLHSSNMNMNTLNKTGLCNMCHNLMSNCNINIIHCNKHHILYIVMDENIKFIWYMCHPLKPFVWEKSKATFSCSEYMKVNNWTLQNRLSELLSVKPHN